LHDLGGHCCAATTFWQELNFDRILRAASDLTGLLHRVFGEFVMKRQRRTLGLLVVWLTAALVAIGPRMPLQIREKAAAVAALKPAVDRPKSRASFQPSASVPVLRGSLASLVADPSHSAGIELARKINLENEGLSQTQNPTWSLNPDNRRRPRIIGWTIFGQQAAAAIWQQAVQAREFESRSTLQGQSPRLPLAVSGWSGCIAYRWSGDDLAQQIELARPANGRRARRLQPVHLAAMIGELYGELGAALGRGTQWWDQTEWVRMAGYLRHEAALAPGAGSVWRSAKSGSQTRIGL
jgi:hypothetical protein